jgi:hypothetical protein
LADRSKTRPATPTRRFSISGWPPSGSPQRLKQRERWFSHFTLTGRAENFLRGRPDLDDASSFTKRPAPTCSWRRACPTSPPCAPVCSSLRKPFNFMVGIKGKTFPLAALAEAGVKRISLASTLYRAAMTAALNAAKEVRERGAFDYINAIIATQEMNAFLSE